MEDSKMTDKRKAPDKKDTLDLDDSSLIEQKPLKRPRMESPTALDKNFEILGQTEDPANVDAVDPIIIANVDDSDVHVLSLNKCDIDEGLNISTSMEMGTLIDDTAIALKETNESIELDLPLENGSSSKEELENLEGYVNEVEIAGDIDDGQNNNGSPISPTIDLKLEERKRSSESNGDHDVYDKSEKAEKTGSRMESSPLSDKTDPPSREVNICLKAFDPKSGKLVYEEPCIRSDYIRLEVFLNSHQLSLTKSSFNSGYRGDIDSEEHIFPFPSHTAGYRKSRYTSSTLGSSIPRDSIKTVYTNSPNDSPDEDLPIKPKKRGKNEPKITSTRLSDISDTDNSPLTGKKRRGSDKLEKMLVSNGQTTSNGFETSKSKTTKRGSSSGSKPSSTKRLSASSDHILGVNKYNKKHTSPSTVDKNTNTMMRSTSTSTPQSRTFSREFSRVTDSPSIMGVEPSPGRAVAIVEGAAAKPLTKFEQEVNNEPLELNSLKHSKTLWGSVATDNPVFARWSDKNYYSGYIKEKGLNDTWIIDFDDATTYPASEGHIIPIKILGVGIKGVYCPDTGYHPADAVIVGQKFVQDPEIGETVKYAIKIAKGENEGKVLWCTRRMLSIKENDARILRQEFQPTPKVFKAAEVSLENIIPESSRRRVTCTPKSSTPQSSTPTIKKVVGGAFDASAADDSQNETKYTPKRKTPKAAKTKPKKRANEISTSSLSGNSRSSRGNSTTLSSTDLSSNAEKSFKESPKKMKLKDKLEHAVFAGYQFFLTASGGGDPTSLGSGSGQVPYDKDEYRDLIERKGGKIVDSVGQEDGKDNLFLVSDNYARTVKYIYSLAASIPCVSHKWVQECITQGKIVAWESYELNAGWSLESNKVILPHKKKPLEGFEIYITAGSNDLYDYWKPVLTAAHAKLLKSKKVKGKVVNDIPKDAQVLVTDSTCSPEVLAEAHERMIPVVKPEWLVQSIIAGNRADFFNHEKYRVEILENEDSYDDDEDDDDDDDDQS